MVVCISKRKRFKKVSNAYSNVMYSSIFEMTSFSNYRVSHLHS